jgi:phosphatidylethanolamine N-methyltransferase
MLSSLHITIIFIVLCPLQWNILARIEYNTHSITKLFGTPQRGCYALAVWIFLTSLLRDLIFRWTIEHHPKFLMFDHPSFQCSGQLLRIIGFLLVISSFFRLGITGTYLGDYFGILMKNKVTEFPFNIVSHPMYMGATMAFLGESLTRKSLVGLLLTALIAIVYYIISIFEGSFTEKIYKNRKRE